MDGPKKKSCQCFEFVHYKGTYVKGLGFDINNSLYP
jgi:hypothetical protein